MMDHRQRLPLATTLHPSYYLHSHHQPSQLLSPVYHQPAYNDPSLLYAPVHYTYPDQHFASQVPQYRHQQQTQPQLSRQPYQHSPYFQSPVERPQPYTLTAPAPTLRSITRLPPARFVVQSELAVRRPADSIMSFNPPVPQASEEQLAELQKLSNEYQPETNDPLVSQRQLTTNITTEYASADPVYRTKTAALPQKYSHYRTVRGDGNCGWRAVTFGYFEALIHLCNTGKIYEELTRLKSMNNVLTQAGYNIMLFEDFADEAFELLQGLATSLTSSKDEAAQLLFEKYNDENLQNYILTYFKTLTAAWMKTHRDQYEAYIPDMSVDDYCDAQIMPVGCEMDHLGLSATNDVLLSPAGIALEVLYLDLSPGTEVTPHSFAPDHASGSVIGIVRLLYRPGHYDILYKGGEVVLNQQPIQTFLQYNTTPTFSDAYDFTHDVVADIPGMSLMPAANGWYASGLNDMSDLFQSPSTMMTCTAPMPTPVAAISHGPVQTQPMYVGAGTATQHLVAPPEQMPLMTQIPHDLPIRTVPLGTSAREGSGHLFRSSAWQLDPGFVEATANTQFQTNIFKNSHFNTAHFNNPDFQPEQWDPQDEYNVTVATTRNGRHRSSS